MATNTRRNSVKPRLRTDQDISTWIKSNQPPLIYIQAPDYVAPAEHVANQVHFAENIEHPYAQSDSDNDSTTSEDSSLAEEPVYTDGGYGWIVVLFSFAMHFIADGLSFSFGVLFPEIQQRFSTERLGASSVASVFLSLPLILGPVAGFYTDVFDCRCSIITGGLLCLAGTFIAIWTESLFGFFCSFGVISGVGLSFIYNAAIVAVTLHFNKKRGRATSIAVSGTGLGTLAFPVILRGLLPYGTTAALTGITVIVSIFVLIGLLINDVKWTSDSQQFKEKLFARKLKKMREVDAESMRNRDLGRVYQDVAPRRACSEPCIPTAYNPSKIHDLRSSIQEINEAADRTEQPARSRSVGTFMACRQQLATVPEFSMITTTGLSNLEHLDLHLGNSPSTTIHSRPRRRMLSKASMSMDAIDNISNIDLNEEDFKIRVESPSEEESEHGSDSEESDTTRSNDGCSSSSELSDKCLKKKEERDKAKADKKLTFVDVQNGAIDKYYLNAPHTAMLGTKNRNSLVAQGMTGMSSGRVPAANAFGNKKRFPSNQIAHQGKMPSAPSLAPRIKKKQVADKLHLKKFITYLEGELENYKHLLVQKQFIMLVMSFSCLYVVLDVPYVFFYDHAVNNLKVNETLAVYLTSGIGLTNLISTYIVGIMADINFFKSRLFTMSSVAMALIAGAFFSVCVVESFTGLMVVCLIFGCLVSHNYVTQSLMLSGMFSNMHMFQSAYALTSCCEGLATLIGPPFVGFIRDAYGSYQPVFIASGCCTMLSAFLLYCVQSHMDALDSDDDMEKRKPSETKHITTRRRYYSHSTDEEKQPLRDSNGSGISNTLMMA